MVYNCRLIALLLYYRPACTRKRLPLYNGITVGVVYTYAAYPGGQKQILKGKKMNLITLVLQVTASYKQAGNRRFYLLWTLHRGEEQKED